MEKVSREQKYQHMRETLNEKQWRQYLAMEAKDRGTIAEVASEAKVSRNTVKRGMRELEAGDIYQPGERIRKEGGGRKPLVQTDATLLSDLEGLLDPKGDPMSLVQWTSKSLSHLTKALQAKGHSIKKSALAELLHQRRFSLRANKKTIEGKGHPDRNAQFRARKLLESIRAGERPDLADNTFFALTLSSNGGRVVIRDWMEGPFEELVEALERLVA